MGSKGSKKKKKILGSGERHGWEFRAAELDIICSTYKLKTNNLEYLAELGNIEINIFFVRVRFGRGY